MFVYRAGCATKELSGVLKRSLNGVQCLDNSGYSELLRNLEILSVPVYFGEDRGDVYALLFLPSRLFSRHFRTLPIFSLNPTVTGGRIGRVDEKE